MKSVHALSILNNEWWQIAVCSQFGYFLNKIRCDFFIGPYGNEGIKMVMYISAWSLHTQFASYEPLRKIHVLSTFICLRHSLSLNQKFLHISIMSVYNIVNYHVRWSVLFRNFCLRYRPYGRCRCLLISIDIYFIIHVYEYIIIFYQFLRKKTFCKNRVRANSPIPNCCNVTTIQRKTANSLRHQRLLQLFGNVTSAL